MSLATSSLKSSGSKRIRVGFIGAGNVNFGGGEGPWNHSLRIEQMYKHNKNSNIEIIGITDINTSRAQSILNNRLLKYPQLYNNCKIYNNYKEMINNNDINAVIIGTSPHVRGSLTNDMELSCIKKGIDVLVEKPISSEQPKEFNKYLNVINNFYKQNQNASRLCSTRLPIISVGYMFRYHPAITKMKSILKELNLPILHVNLRYSCAYSYIDREFWWDQTQSGGPIVEQGTHFVDLARFFTGDHNLSTLQCLSIQHPDLLSNLSMRAPNLKLNNISNENHNPVITSSQWKSNNGAIISFTHGIHLHHKKYETSIDVWCDGLLMSLINPYDEISFLKIRQTSNNYNEACKEYTLSFDNNKIEEDAYYHQIKNFINAIECNNNKAANEYIKSSFNDAANTYNLSWDIRNSSTSTQQLSPKLQEK